MMKDIIRLVAVIAMVLMVMSVGAFLVTYYVIGDLSLANQLRTFAAWCAIAFMPEVIVDRHAFFD